MIYIIILFASLLQDVPTAKLIGGATSRSAALVARLRAAARGEEVGSTLEKKDGN